MIKESLIEWMPDYYTGQNVAAIQNPRDTELQSVNTAQQRTIGDMYVSSAQDLNLWEDEYGIEPVSSSIEDRRKKMIAVLRGMNGAITKQQIISLINSYTGTDSTEITEYPNTYQIRITCNLIPTSIFDFDDMKNMLDEMVQAHVEVLLDAIWMDSVSSSMYIGFAQNGEQIVAPLIST